LSSCSSVKNSTKKKTKEDNRETVFRFNQFFLEGARQKVLGNYETALNNFNRALKVDDTQSAAYFEIAGLLMLIHDFHGAITYAEKAVAIDKTDNEFYKLMLVMAYRGNGLLPEASKVYQSLLKSHPEKIQYYFELANLYVLTNKEKDALKVLNSAEKQFGIVDMISVEKENIYLKLKDYQSATDEIEKLVEAYPNNIKYKAVLAELYLNTQRVYEAGKLYSEIENSEIEDGLLYFSIADYYVMTQNYDKFFQNLFEGFSARDVAVDVKIKILLNIIQSKGNDKRDFENVGKLLDILMNLYPDDVTIKALYSDYCVMLGDYKSAQKVLDFILERDKGKYQIWSQALFVDYALNDMETMYKRGKEAVELFPNILEFYKYYIIAAYYNEKFEEVADAVDYASQLAVSDQQLLLDFLSLQADAYHKLNEHKKSDEVYELILEKDSDYISVLNNYSYFLAERGEKLSRALELSSRLIKLENNTSTYLDTHAWVLFKNGKYQDALSFIDKAINIDSENHVYYDHKGDILYKLGKLDEAVSMWEKALELDDKKSEQIKQKIEQKKIIE
jgi:tetratricopeptide (TPR) repeat protein